MYRQANGYGAVTNDDASLDVIAGKTGTGIYLHIENIAFSVYEQAEGGGGWFRIQGTEGSVIYTADADTVKDFTLNWGEEGVAIAENEGIQIVVGGGQTKQASVSVAISAHWSFRQAG